ncbi:MAG: hypothetical protein AAFY56_02180 [Pseudomonadota bacterium]
MESVKVSWLLSFGLWALLSIFLAGNAPAQSGMGPLDPFLPNGGEEGPWRYERDGTAFRMSNHGDPGALQYFYVNPLPGSEGRRRIAVDVSVEPSGDGNPLAGLLYSFDQNTGSYFLFVLEPGGSVGFYRRDANGFNPVMQSQVDAVRPGTNRLTLIENDRNVSLNVNGEVVGELGMNGIGIGAVGIAAAGLGRFTFDGFVVDAAATQINEAPIDQASDDTLRLKPIEIIDNTGPFGPTPAFSTFVPADWTTEGGVVWNPPSGCHRGGRLIWGASSPDKRYGIAFLPPLSWSANNYGGSQLGCLAMDITDAETAMRTYVDRFAQTQIEILSVERPPEVEQLVQQLANAAPPPATPNARQWQDGVMLRVRAVIEGVETETAFVVLTNHYEVATADGWGQGGMNVARGGNMEWLLALTTPPGELEAGHPAFPIILNNLRANPVWTQQIAQWWASQNKPAPATVASSPTDTSSVSDMMFESWKRRQGMSDDGQAKSVENIWETTRYNSANGPVALSQNYKNAWQLNNGSFVLTDDNFFNPDRTFGQSGQQLELVQ